MPRVSRHTTVASICIAASALVLSACGTSYGSKAPPPPAPHTTVSAATISGVGAVLVGSSGRTLYYLSTETRTSIQCRAGCTSTWTPYVATHGVAPTKTASMTGSLATTARPDGRTQLTFNGHPLYFYVGDSATGQANGEGISGTWFVLHTASRTTSTSSTTPSTSTPYYY